MRSRAELVRDWLAKASSDLRVARREAAASDPATDAACFHCQQAAEKALKAWLLWHGLAAPYTHNLATLVDACAALDARMRELDPVSDLTPYAVEVRYGDRPVWPTPDELGEALALAELTMARVADSLAEAGYRDETEADPA